MTIDPFSALGELVGLHLARIDRADPKLDAFVAADAELALACARAPGARRA